MPPQNKWMNQTRRGRPGKVASWTIAPAEGSYQIINPRGREGLHFNTVEIERAIIDFVGTMDLTAVLVWGHIKGRVYIKLRTRRCNPH